MSFLQINIKVVDRLVRELLKDADRNRWLSLASLLPMLAEVSPEEFIGAVEGSLRKPDQSVTCLLKETSGNTFTGQCYHAGLLWALETLAWSPDWLSRISIILAKLAHVEIKGNYGNTPLSSLVNFYRPWFPQTSVDKEYRISALKRLVTDEPDVAFELLYQLIPNRLGHAMEHQQNLEFLFDSTLVCKNMGQR
ncbi:hypothetical protein [Candidatus Magnetobacterium casense]|uniref:Uncharacterized protein n=1 Tax=Candidatus Magnetobacterium casense TaxID=1455061 RepID=A0ABS6RYA6_9BACT|nr:hypothetical protein [Candidatus Magnetobacterium casensis]MBV6341608.1 hypothetical protein [Candidatus Magnetobacterium casensis]